MGLVQKIKKAFIVFEQDFICNHLIRIYEKGELSGCYQCGKWMDDEA